MSLRKYEINTVYAKVEYEISSIKELRMKLKSIDELYKKPISILKKFLSPQRYTYLTSDGKFHCGEKLTTIGDVKEFVKRYNPKIGGKLKQKAYDEIVAALNLIEIACFPGKNNEAINRILFQDDGYSFGSAGLLSQVAGVLMRDKSKSVIDNIIDEYEDISDKPASSFFLSDMSVGSATQYILMIYVLRDYYTELLKRNNDVDECNIFECVYAKFQNYVDDLKRQAEKMLKEYNNKTENIDAEFEYLFSKNRRKRIKREFEQYLSLVEFQNELNIAKIILAEMEAYKNDKMKNVGESTKKVLVKKAENAMNS